MLTLREIIVISLNSHTKLFAMVRIMFLFLLQLLLLLLKFLI